jgi:UDP-GlcNAc:undecaprenyl-phosphate GlcNAc-1-phosphate transferase
MFDLVFAVIRRATGRKSLANADKGHLHHRLMDLGHGHRRSVVILWTWTALLSGFVLYPTLTGQNPTYLPFGIAALGIMLFTILHPSVRARRRSNGLAAADDASNGQSTGSNVDTAPAAAPTEDAETGATATTGDESPNSELPSVGVDH